MKKGERIVPASDLDARLKILSGQINSILAGIAIDDTIGAFKNFMLQSGTVTVKIGIESTVTFPVEYSVTPKITYGANTTDDANVVFNTPTTAGFKLRAFNRTGGSDIPVHWIAFGKRI